MNDHSLMYSILPSAGKVDTVLRVKLVSPAEMSPWPAALPTSSRYLVAFRPVVQVNATVESGNVESAAGLVSVANDSGLVCRNAAAPAAPNTNSGKTANMNDTRTRTARTLRASALPGIAAVAPAHSSSTAKEIHRNPIH